VHSADSAATLSDMHTQFDIVGHLKLEEAILKARLADRCAEMRLVH